MNWQSITVFQWQQLMELYSGIAENENKDVSIKAASIITGKTEKQIMGMPLSEIYELSEKLNFVHTEIPTKKINYISVNGKRYRCNYNIKDMEAARYIETKHFTSDFQSNIHKIAASMVIPQKLTLLGWKDDKYDARKHDQYAEDLLSASITDVMGSVVFFYLVFKTWIKVFRDYLKKEIMKAGMKEYQAEMTIQVLCDTMDGFIKPNWLRTMRKLHLKNPLNFQQSTF